MIYKSKLIYNMFWSEKVKNIVTVQLEQHENTTATISEQARK